jgi:hypothetical protein
LLAFLFYPHWSSLTCTTASIMFTVTALRPHPATPTTLPTTRLGKPRDTARVPARDALGARRATHVGGHTRALLLASRAVTAPCVVEVVCRDGRWRGPPRDGPVNPQGALVRAVSKPRGAEEAATVLGAGRVEARRLSHVISALGRDGTLRALDWTWTWANEQHGLVNVLYYNSYITQFGWRGPLHSKPPLSIYHRSTRSREPYGTTQWGRGAPTCGVWMVERSRLGKKPCCCTEGSHASQSMCSWFWVPVSSRCCNVWHIAASSRSWESNARRSMLTSCTPRPPCAVERCLGGMVGRCGALRVKKMPNLEDLEAAIRFSKPAPTRFPSFPASSMASSCSVCCRCSGVSRRCDVAVLAFFSVILCFWRWLFTLLGGG